MEYDNIYSSNVVGSTEKMPRHKHSVQPHYVMPKNISEIKLKQRRTPIPDIKNTHQMYSNESEEKYYQDTNDKNSSNLDESRNSSLVVINTNEQNKNLSKSRPKQRQAKLIEDTENKVSSILKMLEK